MPAEDADATRALLSETLFAEQLHGRSYYYHEKSGASQFDKPKAPREPDSSDSEDDMSSDEPYDIEPYDRAQQDWQRRRNARRNARRWRRRQERLLNIFSNLFSF